MGIRYLNSYLTKKCTHGICTILLGTLSHTTVVIDTSIYLYKFKSVDSLVTSMTQLLDLFQSHSIHPIFVFDGKPKTNKKHTLQKRQQQKQIAWDQYQQVRHTETPEVLQALKKTFIRVSQRDVESIKSLMDSREVRYIQAPHEADEVCARMMHQGIAQYMFVYGCSRVLRQLNLQDGTATLYQLEHMLKTLRISVEDFQMICILSGTDYSESTHTIYDYMKWYDQFIKSGKVCFHDWLVEEKRLSTLDRKDFMILSDDFNYLDPLIRQALPSSGSAGSCTAEG
jgi:XPG N-terminal domain/XPG I-region